MQNLIWEGFLKHRERQKKPPYSPSSFGEKIDSLDSGEELWELSGDLRIQYYTSIHPKLLEHLSEIFDTACIGDWITLPVYMVGRHRTNAVPTVIVCSRDEKARKRAKNEIKKSGFLKQHGGFKVVSLSEDPGMRNMKQLASDGSNIETVRGVDLATRVLFNVSKPVQHLGMEVWVDHGSSLRPATCFVASVGGRIFLETVYHAFVPTTLPSKPTVRKAPLHIDSDSDDSDSDFDTEDEAEDDFNVAITSIGSQSPDAWSDSGSDSERSSASALSSGSSTPSADDTQPADQSTVSLKLHEVTSRLAPLVASPKVYPPKQIVQPSRDALATLGHLVTWSVDKDWALVEITDAKLSSTLKRLTAENPSPVKPLPRLKDDSKVVAYTSSGGTLTGTFSGIPILTRLPNSTSFQEVHRVCLNGALANGDCGSAVKDAVTGELYGHIVAGCEAMGTAYIMAAHQIEADFSALTAKDFSALDIWSNHAPLATQTGETSDKHHPNQDLNIVSFKTVPTDRRLDLFTVFENFGKFCYLSRYDSDLLHDAFDLLLLLVVRLLFNISFKDALVYLVLQYALKSQILKRRLNMTFSTLALGLITIVTVIASLIAFVAIPTGFLLPTITCGTLDFAQGSTYQTDQVYAEKDAACLLLTDLALFAPWNIAGTSAAALCAYEYATCGRDLCNFVRDLDDKTLCYCGKDVLLRDLEYPDRQPSSIILSGLCGFLVFCLTPGRVTSTVVHCWQLLSRFCKPYILGTLVVVAVLYYTLDRLLGRPIGRIKLALFGIGTMWALIYSTTDINLAPPLAKIASEAHVFLEALYFGLIAISIVILPLMLIGEILVKDQSSGVSMTAFDHFVSWGLLGAGVAFDDRILNVLLWLHVGLLVRAALLTTMHEMISVRPSTINRSVLLDALLPFVLSVVLMHTSHSRVPASDSANQGFTSNPILPYPVVLASSLCLFALIRSLVPGAFSLFTTYQWSVAIAWFSYIGWESPYTAAFESPRNSEVGRTADFDGATWIVTGFALICVVRTIASAWLFSPHWSDPQRRNALYAALFCGLGQAMSGVNIVSFVYMQTTMLTRAQLGSDSGRVLLPASLLLAFFGFGATTHQRVIGQLRSMKAFGLSFLCVLVFFGTGYLMFGSTLLPGKDVILDIGNDVLWQTGLLWLAPALVQLSSVWLMPESPRSLIHRGKGRYSEAYQSMMSLRSPSSLQGPRSFILAHAQLQKRINCGTVRQTEVFKPPFENGRFWTRLVMAITCISFSAIWYQCSSIYSSTSGVPGPSWIQLVTVITCISIIYLFIHTSTSGVLGPKVRHIEEQVCIGLLIAFSTPLMLEWRFAFSPIVILALYYFLWRMEEPRLRQPSKETSSTSLSDRKTPYDSSISRYKAYAGFVTCASVVVIMGINSFLLQEVENWKRMSCGLEIGSAIAAAQVAFNIYRKFTGEHLKGRDVYGSFQQDVSGFGSLLAEMRGLFEVN
jgi:hypothetical protein